MDYDNYGQEGYNYNSDPVPPPPQQNYSQPPYGSGYYYGSYPPPAQKTNPLAIVSMILGIVSLVFAIVLCCCAPGVNMPFAIASVVTGILQLKSTTNQNGRGMAKAGIITGSISAALFIIELVLYVFFFIMQIITEESTSSYYNYF